MIEDYEPLPDTQTYGMTDSWYVSQDLLKLCRQRRFHFIGAVKSNRKLTGGTHNLQVKQWQACLPKTNLVRVKLQDKFYKVWSLTGHLSCGTAVKCLINRRIGDKKWHYLISTDLDLSTRTIIASYLKRWEVENFYRAAKQILGWGDYQMRDLRAIENPVVRMMITHAYLEIQRRDALAEVAPSDAHFTLGDLQREHQRQAQRSTLALVFSLVQQGFGLSDIYDRLAV